MSQHDLASAAASDYRGRRRAVPADPGTGAAGAAGEDDQDVIDLTVVEVPPPLTRMELLQQRRALEEALEASHEAEPPPPVTRRQIAEQRRSEESHATFGPSLSAIALGAASVAMAAAVAGHVYGGPGAATAAADRVPSGAATASTATTTSGEAVTVDPETAMAALRGTPSLPAGVQAASRSNLRPLLPGCSGKVTDYSYANGQVPKDELCALTFAPGHHLRADAAVALAMLNIAYRSHFHSNLCITDSYRTLAAQARLAARKPGLAARPGTSEHGMGLAVDFCAGIQTYGSTRYDWMRANAPTFGWANPAWAIPPSSREEPWHWEYVVGEKKTSAA